MSAPHLTTGVRGPGTRIVRRPGWSLAYDRRALGRTCLLVVAVIALAAFAVTRGPIDIGYGELLRVLTGGGESTSRLVVLEWRLPRVVMAVAAGAALGAAGSLVQTITRNPLGSPDVIGFSAGSYFGVLVAVVVLHAPAAARGPAAIVGGVAAALAVWLLAYRRGVSAFRLIIVGIGVSSLLTGLSSWLTLISSQEEYTAVLFWGAGSLDALHWSGVVPATAAIAALLAAAVLLVPALRQLELGDQRARASGTSVDRSRMLALGLAIVLVAIVTATCGPIEFIALAAPQIARRLVRTASTGLASSATVGALLLLTADLVGEQLSPVAMPAGIVTLIFGGAYLTALLIREARRS